MKAPARLTVLSFFSLFCVVGLSLSQQLPAQPPEVLQPLALQPYTPETDVDPAQLNLGPQPVAQNGLHSQLYRAESIYADSNLSFDEKQRLMAERQIELRADGKVRVEIFRPVDEDAVTREQLLPFGGEVIYRVYNAVEGYLPADQLSSCAAALPEGTQIRQCGLGIAAEGFPGLFEGSGTWRTGARNYRQDGFNGTGMTIGIVDVSYGGYMGSFATQDAPLPVTVANYTDSSMWWTERNHGRFVTETLYDYAPQADYHLAKISSVTQAALAIQTMVVQGCQIINLSLGYIPEWDDDSDVLCLAANVAGAAGSLVFKSCGNRALVHYIDQFIDNDGDNWHNYEGFTDETLSVLVPDDEWASFSLRWDTTAGLEDFDLFLMDATNTITLDSSTAGGTTFEDVAWKNETGATQLVQVLVRRNFALPTTEFEIYSSDVLTWTEHQIPISSYTSPANASHPNVLAIGAVHRQFYSQPSGENGLIADYSSWGPSKGGLQVPDFCCVSRTEGSFFGTFIGTSAAAPNAAGVAAVLWSANPAGPASAVRAVLEDWAALYRDWGMPGPDRLYGIGGICMTPHDDCNNNDFPDAFDILSGALDDDNGDWVPDPCQSPGYQLDLYAPDNTPFHPIQGTGNLKVLATLSGLDNSPAGPLPPIVGFQFSVEYDDTLLSAPSVQPTQALLDLLGGPPAVFNVTHVPGGGATAGPATTTVDVLFSAAGGIQSTFPMPTRAVTFDFQIGHFALTTPPTVCISSTLPAELDLATGGTIPPANGTLEEIVVVFDDPLFRFNIEDARTTLDASAGGGTIETFVTLQQESRDASGEPIGGFQMVSTEFSSEMTPTAVSMSDDLAAINGGLGPDLFMPTLLPNSFSVDCIFDTTDTEIFQVARRMFSVECSLDPGLFGVTRNTVTTARIQAGTVDSSVISAGINYDAAVDDAVVTIVVNVNSGEFIRGDANIDGTVNIGDPVATLAYLFNAGVVDCLDAMDTNDDGSVDIADPVATLGYLFSMGAEPPAPFPNCGEDVTPDSQVFNYQLGCENTSCP